MKCETNIKVFYEEILLKDQQYYENISKHNLTLMAVMNGTTSMAASLKG